MSIVCLIFKQTNKNTHTQNKMYFQNARKNVIFQTTVLTSYTMVLYIESTLDQYGLDLSKMGPLLC